MFTKNKETFLQEFGTILKYSWLLCTNIYIHDNLNTVKSYRNVYTCYLFINLDVNDQCNMLGKEVIILLLIIIIFVNNNLV